jgi:hypothetical protein
MHNLGEEPAMSDTIRTYIADSELASLLKAAAESGGRVRVVANGEMYDLQIAAFMKSPDIWKDYDPAAFREALYASAGVLKGSGIDVEEWLEEIRESRKQDSPGRPAE